MFGKLFDSNEKQLNKVRPLLQKINSFEDTFAQYSPEQIKQKTQSWKDEIRALSETDQPTFLNKILPEAYALVREASKRVFNMRIYDEQMLAGIVLHQGKISEQKTGEGKTLTATLPLYLNSLTGKGAHLVTPNDYLSRHGAGWMGVLYEFLGVSVGCIMQEEAFVYDLHHESVEFQDEYARHLRKVPKAQAYTADITYGTNHEFGFDYLRDNMAGVLEDIVQTNAIGQWGEHYFAIVDEVD
ncbi:preprotein translocase subunit SecA, partial [Patescibacteria group bacterium]|nr:preprotein translocase subunit SecA [Patescibacteria group bacterium]